MKKISFRKKLQSKKIIFGSWISFGFTQTCEIMARAQFDFLVIDMEHTSINYSQCLSLIQVIESNGVVPIVRVGANNPLLIKQAMDVGAHGIIVPMVSTVEDAQNAIDALYYPPKGKRGVGLSRAQNYGVDFDKYKKWADNESIFIPQIEHIDGVNNIEKILALDEVDGFIIGPYDLSASLGQAGNWEHPSVIEAIEKVNNILSLNEKPGGYHVVHADRAEVVKRIKQGYRLIAYGVDMILFSESIASESKFISDIKK